jgi:hypothetical protein
MEVANMTLGELRSTYSSVHKEYNSTKYNLSVKVNEMKDKVANSPNGQELYGEQLDTLELQYNPIFDSLREIKSLQHQ